MCNQHQLQLVHIVDYINQFLHHCCQTKNYNSIKKLHAHILKTSILSKHQNLQTKLIYAYSTCISQKNLQIFPKLFSTINLINPLTLNILISDYCRNGFPLLALHTCSVMHKNGVSLDTYALCSSLKASILIKDVEFGKQLHTHVFKSGWYCSVFLGSTLIDLYSKSLLTNDALKVFDEIPMKNTVCANALLSGFCEAKLWINGIELIRKMPMLNLKYDHFTLSAILRVCAALCAIELGKQAHTNVIRVVSNFSNDVFLQSSLIDMYGKCGQVEKSWQVFNFAGLEHHKESKRDVVLWTSMLGVYGKNGYFKEVIKLYKHMIIEGVKPDEVAFVTVISACGHTGQMKLGMEFFESMDRDFGLKPGLEHYSCVVDLLCRAGELEMAWKVVDDVSYKKLGKGSVSMLGALLNACLDRGNVELGKMAAQRALEMDPCNAGIYVLLSNLYAKLGMWDEIENLRKIMNVNEVDKDVGFSRVDSTS